MSAKSASTKSVSSRAKSPSSNSPSNSSNRKVVGLSVGIISVMALLTIYSVPLYRLFCEVTGFGGTPVIAEGANKIYTLADPATARLLKVSFDTSQSPSLKWQITDPNLISVNSGEQVTVYYTATNLLADPTKGMSVFNVTPQGIAPYVHKIACFCFEEQTLKPNETRRMRIDFYISSDLFKEPRFNNLSDITFSYSFFEA